MLQRPVIIRSGGEAPLNLIGYAGALTDLHTDVTGIPSTSYVHLGQRWHNPAAGSFTTQDTASVLANPQNGNRYAYAADNPVTYTDPTGQGDWFGSLVIGVLGASAACAPWTTVLSFACGVTTGALVWVAENSTGDPNQAEMIPFGAR